MSVAVTLSVADGLIMGVDSATAISYGPGKTNIYEDAEKLFSLGTKRIGVATFGMAGIGTRSIGSFVREFEYRDVDGVECPMADIVEAMRRFFYDAYVSIIIPAVETLQGMPSRRYRLKNARHWVCSLVDIPLVNFYLRFGKYQFLNRLNQTVPHCCEVVE